MKSTGGRPRALTDDQVVDLLMWYRKFTIARRRLQRLKTLREKAKELGVSPSTLLHAIAREGRYKQPSPELREAAQEARRERIARLRSQGYL